MEDEDAVPNKRGEAYCACRYLNCGRQFKSLKALEEHLITHHNISWEAYTRYSPTRHHETIEETTTDSLGKRKDAYCQCTYMECGRKFKMLKNLEEHVTLYHNISWQLYTQYYHRAVRKAPEEKAKSPKAEKKTPPFTAVKTSESPSPSSSGVRSASNGSASTTPVSAGMGIASPVSPNPVVSFLPQGTNTAYGQYPYLTAQVPIVPAIIQYQPMFTAPVIGYASPTTLPLAQSYMSQSPISMSPLTDNVSWFQGQSTPQNPYQQAQSPPQKQQVQEESGILNLSCPKSKKTRPSSPPSKTLDLSKYSSRTEHKISTSESYAKSINYAGSTSKQCSIYTKHPVEDLHKFGLPKPQVRESTSTRTAFTEVKGKYTNEKKLSPSKHIPATQNGVIVIQPDDDYDDKPYRPSYTERVRTKIEDSSNMESYQQSDPYRPRHTTPSQRVQHSSISTSRNIFSTRRSQEAIHYRPWSPKQCLHQQHDKVEDLQGVHSNITSLQDQQPSYVHDEDDRSSTRKHPHHGQFTSSQNHQPQQQQPISSSSTTTLTSKSLERKLSSSSQMPPLSTHGILSSQHSMQPMPKQPNLKLDDTYQEKATEEKAVQSSQISLPVSDVGPSMNQNIKSGLFHVDSDNEAPHSTSIDTGCHLRPTITTDKQSRKEIIPLQLVNKKNYLPIRKIKRSSSLPNLATFAERDEDSPLDDRLVIDISDEHTGKELGKRGFAEDSVLADDSCNGGKNAEFSKKSARNHLKAKSRNRCKNQSSKRNRCPEYKGSSNELKRSKKLASVTVMFKIQKKYRHLLWRKQVLYCQSTVGFGALKPRTSSPLSTLILNPKPNSTVSHGNPCTNNCDSVNCRQTRCKCKWAKLLKLKWKQRRSISPSVQKLDHYKRIASSCSSPSEQFELYATPSTSTADTAFGKVNTNPNIEQQQICNKVQCLKVLASARYASLRSDSKESNKAVIYDTLKMQPKKEKSSQSTKQSSNIKDSNSSSIEEMYSVNELKLVRSPPTFYQWRTLQFLHHSTLDSPCDTKRKNAVSLFCKACDEIYNSNTEYVKHRIEKHRSFRCKLCQSEKRGHLYRYLSTLSRHLMLDHSMLCNVDPWDFVTQDTYGGVDLQGVPFLENLDGVALVTDDKIYVSNAVHSYTLHPGVWTLSHVTSTDRHQAVPQCMDQTMDSTSRGRSSLKVVSTKYPPVLITITESQYLMPTLNRSISLDSRGVTGSEKSSRIKP